MKEEVGVETPRLLNESSGEGSFTRREGFGRAWGSDAAPRFFKQRHSNTA